MIKKRAKGLPSSFEKRKKVLEKMEAKKSLSPTRIMIGDTIYVQIEAQVIYFQMK